MAATKTGADSFFIKGDKVRLINLKSRADLNGCECEILTGEAHPSSSKEDPRYAVRVVRGGAIGENILVKPKNMVDVLIPGSPALASIKPELLAAAAASAAAASSDAQSKSGATESSGVASSGAPKASEAEAAKAMAAGKAAPGQKDQKDKASESSVGGEKQPRLRQDVSVIEQLMTRRKGLLD